MAMVNIPFLVYPPTQWSQNSNTIGSTAGLLLDAAGEKAALIFKPPKVGNIRKVHFRTGTVTTGATIDIRFETVSSSVPTGTLWGTNTNVSHVLGNGDDDLWITSNALTADAVITQTDLNNGTWIALVFVNPGVSPGNFYIANTPIHNQGSVLQFLAVLTSHFTASWSSSTGTGRPNIAIEYDDGSIPPIYGLQPVKTINSVVATTSSNPDEIALKFTQKGKARACGFYIATFGGTLSFPYRVQIYEDGNNTPIASAIIDGQTLSSGGSSSLFSSIFPIPVILTNGTVYRLAFLPTTTNGNNLRYIEQESNSIFAACEGGVDMIYSARNRSSTTDPDTAVWTDTNTRRLSAGIIYDQIDDGAGGGGGSTIIAGNMRGGFVN